MLVEKSYCDWFVCFFLQLSKLCGADVTLLKVKPSELNRLYSKSNCPIGDFNFHSRAWEMIKTVQTSYPDLIVFPSPRGTDGNSSQVRKCNRGSVWKCHFLCIMSKSPLKCILSLHWEWGGRENALLLSRGIYIIGKKFDLVILFSCCAVFF